MKKRDLLFTILLLVTGTLSAQKEWENLIAEKPLTVIREADSLIQYGNHVDKIQGMILKARAEVSRDRSRYPEIEWFAAEAPDLLPAIVRYTAGPAGNSSNYSKH